MKSLLHIGMPKCMSTSLQTFLRQTKGVYFMGIGPSKFVDPDVLDVFQRQILRTPTQFYDSEAVRRVFETCTARACDADARLFALSDENIPFPIGYGPTDVSYCERMQRLKAFMPEPATVLILTRRPARYLRSVYKYETVMHGLNFTYDEFLKRLLLHGDTGFLATVKFAAFAREAERIFGQVRVVSMEAILENKRALSSIFAELGIGMPQLPPHENAGMADEKFENFRAAHAPYGDTLANNHFNTLSPADRQHAQADLAAYGSVVASIMQRDQSLGTLRNLATQLPDRPATGAFEMSETTRAALGAYVAEANAALKEQFGVDTDAHKYGEF